MALAPPPDDCSRAAVDDRGRDLGGASLALRTTSDKTGRFTLDGVPAGLASVLVLAAEHHGRVVSGIHVPAGGEAPTLSVELGVVSQGEEPGIEPSGPACAKAKCSASNGVTSISQPAPSLLSVSYAS